MSKNAPILNIFSLVLACLIDFVRYKINQKFLVVSVDPSAHFIRKDKVFS